MVVLLFFFLMIRRPPISSLFPYPALFRSRAGVWDRLFAALAEDPTFEWTIIVSTIVRAHQHAAGAVKGGLKLRPSADRVAADRKSTRLNSSHANISYAVFCLKKKNKKLVL